MAIRTGLGKKREQQLKRELDRILNKIIELNPIKVILFGSLNENNVGKESDIDIAIIKETNKTYSKRIDEIYEKINPRVAIDFFVYTPEEIKKFCSTNSFIKRLLERGTVIYEA
jgi:predicted nucleotidyltransferase